MDREFVLARAWGGEPIKRVVFGAAERVVYLANPDSVPAVEAGESHPLGFPKSDVFAFDSGLYERLRKEWDASGAVPDGMWASARPYRFN